MSMPEKCARMVPRMPGDTFGPLRLATELFGSVSAHVQDISVLGIGLIAEKEYPVGTQFVIEAGPNGQNLKNALTAVLRHATQQPNGHWLLGCSFARLLTIDDVVAMG
jgi:hypothetical protein